MSADAAHVSRRELLGVAAGGAAAIGLGATLIPGLMRHASRDLPARAARARSRPGYGPLRAPDAYGIQLPEGFSAREVARSGRAVPGTSYVFHGSPDGAATFATPDGGWIYVSNCEVPGGAGAIRFDRTGGVTAAYPVLHGTQYNCSGGATAWGTWLSCEEVPTGLVWECDPFGRRAAVARPAMGSFMHEAAAADPVERRIYLNEDVSDGRLYRFTPERWGKLDRGLLEVASARNGRVSWMRVPDPSGQSKPTRYQVRDSTLFLRSEGLRLTGRTLYIGTTLNSTIQALDLGTSRIRTIYEADNAPKPQPLVMPDQMTSSHGGELFVAEDNERPEFSVAVFDPPHSVTRFLTVGGPIHKGSELSGVAFDPSGTRLYFASQRAYGDGAIYEVSGPFRRRWR